MLFTFEKIKLQKIMFVVPSIIAYLIITLFSFVAPPTYDITFVEYFSCFQNAEYTMAGRHDARFLQVHEC